MTLHPATDAASPFQYIPVPNEHVPAVLAFLGELLTTSAVAAVPHEPNGEPQVPATAPLVGLAVEGWTDEQLTTFFGMGTKTSQNVERMLRHLAHTPGIENAVSTRDLAEVLSMKYSEMKILPTQVARSLGKHFPGMTAPWSYRSGPDFDPPRGNEVYFWATATRAEQLSRIDVGQAS